MWFRSYVVYGLMVLSGFSWAAWTGQKIPRPTGASQSSSGNVGFGGGHVYHGGSSSSSGWSWGK